MGKSVGSRVAVKVSKDKIEEVSLRKGAYKLIFTRGFTLFA